MSEDSGKIEVAIVEDDDGIREHLEFFLDQEEAMYCVGAFDCAESALEGLGPAPDVILMDINMPGMSGIECTRRIKRDAKFSGTQIIMLTVHDDTEQIFESLQAGATGYMLKRTPAPELLQGIRDVVDGGSPMNSEIARKVIQLTISPTPSKEPVRDLEDLTSREKNVLEFLAKGATYKEIAYDLEIKIDTVRNHIRRIYEKLQVNNRTEAVVKFLGE